MKLLGRDRGEFRLPMCAVDAAGEGEDSEDVGGVWVVESRRAIIRLCPLIETG